MDGKDAIVFTVSLSNEFKARTIRTVLAYEAALRGLTKGRVLCELIVEGALAGEMDGKLRDRIAEIREGQSRDAADAALAELGSPGSA